MQKLFCLSLFFLLLFFSSCQTPLTPEEEVLQKNIYIEESIKKGLQNELRWLKNIRETETAELLQYKYRGDVLIKEKRAIDDYLFTTRSNIRNIFLEIQQNIQKTLDELYDCYVGNETIKRNKLLISNNVLLVDLGNPALFDMTLLEGEIFCDSASVVRFCTVRQTALTGSLGTYEVASVGPEYKSEIKADKVAFKFSGRDALRLKQGEYIGIFLNAGTQLFYDEKGTGKTYAVPMMEVSSRKPFEIDSELIPDKEGRAYSFRLWGFKRSW